MLVEYKSILPPDSNLYLYVFEQQHLIKCSGFIVKIYLNNIYFLPRTIDPFQTSVFDQTYLLTPRLLQTSYSYVNALILESRSIIIYSFNLKSSEKFWKFDFFRNFRTSELSQTTPSPRPGMSEISKPPPPHLPDVLCRRPLRAAENFGYWNLSVRFQNP